MAQILSGKVVAKAIFANIKKEIEEHQLKPKLVIIIIGHDPAAEFYVQNLEKKGSKIGISVQTRKFTADISEADILKEISLLNDDKSIHGIMIQKPLPSHVAESKIVLAIDPAKDMDGFHPVNIGNMILDQAGFIPSTPAAVLEMLRFYNIETAGRKVVILGRSNIVGKPLANLLLRKDQTGNATVTVCHSRTKNLAEITNQADILIAAIGRANYVQPEMIKQNVVVIDVGVNQIVDLEKGQKYVGDVDFEKCSEKCSMITPVPGGVGTVTTAVLLNNVLKSTKKLTVQDNFIDEKWLKK
ncbi:MAG: tetrahydrofolate dehydrogenase/cyclohydrolase catalytic domain-containing protein [Candidatus Cloacimonadales bacterium]|nr:tetrahydrofolate dehydrogenase/cyclohydrolase catalytic domain-containing protein [Candidatus Cloacimonadales bacterium]